MWYFRFHHTCRRLYYPPHQWWKRSGWRHHTHKQSRCSEHQLPSWFYCFRRKCKPWPHRWVRTFPRAISNDWVHHRHWSLLQGELRRGLCLPAWRDLRCCRKYSPWCFPRHPWFESDGQSRPKCSPFCEVHHQSMQPDFRCRHRCFRYWRLRSSPLLVLF